MSLALLIAVGVIAVLLLAAGVAWLLGYPVQGLDPLRASTTEAGERAAEISADFMDWIRREH